MQLTAKSSLSPGILMELLYLYDVLKVISLILLEASNYSLAERWPSTASISSAGLPSDSTIKWTLSAVASFLLNLCSLYDFFHSEYQLGDIMQPIPSKMLMTKKNSTFSLCMCILYQKPEIVCTPCTVRNFYLFPYFNNMIKPHMKQNRKLGAMLSNSV